MIKDIQKRKAFFDRKSIDPYTHECNQKYKLTCSKIVGVFYFHVLTKDAKCRERYKYCFKRDDWEKIVGKYLERSRSYVDIRNLDIINDEDLIKKRKDRENGFEFVALLRDEKYRDFKEYCSNYIMLKDLTSGLREKIINSVSDETNEKIAQDTIKKLGLG